MRSQWDGSSRNGSKRVVVKLGMMLDVLCGETKL